MGDLVARRVIIVERGSVVWHVADGACESTLDVGCQCCNHCLVDQ